MKYIGLVLIVIAALIPTNEPIWKQGLVGILIIIGMTIWILE